MKQGAGGDKFIENTAERPNIERRIAGCHVRDDFGGPVLPCTDVKRFRRTRGSGQAEIGNHRHTPVRVVDVDVDEDVVGFKIPMYHATLVQVVKPERDVEGENDGNGTVEVTLWR